MDCRELDPNGEVYHCTTCHDDPHKRGCTVTLNGVIYKVCCYMRRKLKQ
jgi:hypothetical protein